jgi:hypothetical protein
MGLNALGIISSTIVENAVFTNSYQKKAGDREAINTYRAQLAEIEQQLSNPELTKSVRVNLNSKAAAIRILLSGKE